VNLFNRLFRKPDRCVASNEYTVIGTSASKIGEATKLCRGTLYRMLEDAAKMRSN
jgi:hypothetical protein